MVNPKNFEAMLASKRKNTIPEETSNSVKLLEITLDNKVNFEKHIGSVSKFASCWLNALFKLKNFLGFKESKTLIESFV